MQTHTLGHALRFVESRDLFSVYRARDGELVYLAHGSPMTRYTVDFEDLDLDEEWSAFAGSREEFTDYLRAILGEQEYIVDDIEWCAKCADPTHTDDGRTVDGDRFACDSCVESYYYSCHDCGAHVSERTWTLYEEGVCQSCCDDDYTFCEACDGYYRDTRAGEHEHNDDDDDDDGCCCASPAQEFAIRNDGDDPLDNDTRTTVTLPAGVIDDEGLNRIRRYLYGEDLGHEASVIDDLGSVWQTREGNFTKRFSRAVYKQFGRKVSPAVVSMIGTIAGEHSRSVDYTIEVTRDLNQDPSEFAHEGSCWWQSYSSSRCTLKSNGGFGLRTFNNYGVAGRVWVIPLKLTETRSLVPTFETMTPDAFVVFNGYGDLGGYTGARIVAHMAGMTYRKIGFQGSPMYVNSDMGYLVAPEEIAEPYTDGSLYLAVNSHSSLFEDEQLHHEKETAHVA